RAAGGREHDEGRALVDRRLEALDHGFARGHAERAAHEVEILHADHHRLPFELAEAELDGIVGAGLGARILEAVGVTHLVTEPERIERRRGDRDIEPGLVIEHRLEPQHRPHAHMVVGAGDDELVGLDVLVEDELAGLRTFDPEIFRRVAAREVIADFRPDDVGDPVHDAVLSSAYMDCRRSPGNRAQRRRCAFGLSAKPNARSPSNSVGASLVRARSIVSRRSLVVTPPLAEKPPALPPAASTRWHGTMIGNGFRPSACPTSRARARSPSRAAISPYESVAPGAMLRATSQTRRSNSGTPSMSSAAADRSL